MESEIEKVRTCLDEIEKKVEVTNHDLARALRSFVSNCYVRHVEITTRNAKEIGEIAQAVKPISEWIKPKIEREQAWRESRKGILIHLIKWASVISFGWLVLVFGEGLRSLVVRWLVG